MVCFGLWSYDVFIDIVMFLLRGVEIFGILFGLFMMWI